MLLVHGIGQHSGSCTFFAHIALHLLSDLPAIVNGHNSGNGLGHNNNNNNNNNNADSELADISQTRLRSLIETIIAETLRSTSLSASGAVSEISLDTRSHASGNGLKRRHRTEHYFEPKIYQDLLATAVLNKVSRTDLSSMIPPVVSRLSTPSPLKMQPLCKPCSRAISAILTSPPPRALFPFVRPALGRLRFSSCHIAETDQAN